MNKAVELAQAGGSGVGAKNEWTARQGDVDVEGMLASVPRMEGGLIPS
jgi:hypothetical protein